MDILEEIVLRLRAVEARGRRPARIEIGDAQAERLAETLKSRTFGQEYTRDDIRAPTKTRLFGTPLVVVESPDYLAVLAEDAR